MNKETLKIKRFFSQITSKVLPVSNRYRNDFRSMNTVYKADKTLLTDADLEIQSILVQLIRNFDNDSYVIAEEVQDLFNPPLDKASCVWIIDPIDGTAQFANLNSREFCIALCKYSYGVPIAALIIMPQLGYHSTPIIAEAFCKEKLILINNLYYDCTKKLRTKNISCTRSKNDPEHFFESTLIKEKYLLKTSTTSQSIDLLRTACDISSISDLTLPKFDFFYRKNQNLWDGAPGFCFNYITDNIILDKDYKNLLPLSYDLLKMSRPKNNEVFVGNRDLLVNFKERN